MGLSLLSSDKYGAGVSFLSVIYDPSAPLLSIVGFESSFDHSFASGLFADER